MKHEKLKWKLTSWIWRLEDLDMFYDLEIMMDEYEEEKEKEKEKEKEGEND